MKTIDVSISDLNYNKKPQGDTIRMMTFKKETLSVDELATLISEGIHSVQSSIRKNSVQLTRLTQTTNIHK